MQDLQLKQFADIQRWKEINRQSSKQQLVLQLGHINHENNIDPVKGQKNKIISQEKHGNVVETTSTVGITTKKGGLTDFFEAMLINSEMGYLPGFSTADIKKLRRDMNKQTPEECDYWTDISIVKYPNQEASTQALKNIIYQFTKGFVNSTIPGTDNTTIVDALKNPIVREAARKQGTTDEQIDKILKQAKSASEAVVKLNTEKNLKYKEGKFHGYPAVYLFPPTKIEQKPKRKKTNNIKEIRRLDGSVLKIKASGGTDTRIKLPKDAFKKEDLPIDGNVLQAVQAENYIISGGLINSLNYMQTGKTFCQSLTKFKTETKTIHEGEMTFIDHFVIPINSTLEEEGYLSREETESMILKLISLL